MVTEDEVQTVLYCLTLERELWGQVMRYGRLFTPGTVVGGLSPRPVYSRRNACRHSVASGLLYAEGVGFHGFAYAKKGWCVDGDSGAVVEPTFPNPATAYFGVVLRPEYMRRAIEASRDDDGEEGFMGVYLANPRCPLPDPDVDMVHDLGRDIPASVRDWALTAEVPPGPTQEPPAWVLDELRRGDGGGA